MRLAKNVTDGRWNNSISLSFRDIPLRRCPHSVERRHAGSVKSSQPQRRGRKSIIISTLEPFSSFLFEQLLHESGKLRAEVDAYNIPSNAAANGSDAPAVRILNVACLVQHVRGVEPCPEELPDNGQPPGK